MFCCLMLFPIVLAELLFSYLVPKNCLFPNVVAYLVPKKSYCFSRTGNHDSSRRKNAEKSLTYLYKCAGFFVRGSDSKSDLLKIWVVGELCSLSPNGHCVNKRDCLNILLEIWKTKAIPVSKKKEGETIFWVALLVREQSRTKLSNLLGLVFKSRFGHIPKDVLLECRING